MQNVVIRTTEQLDFRTKEAYKTLRTNLSFAGKDVKVISLTSCTPNEGKSSVSFQLCMSLAESGKKTVLVDADMRRSVLRGRYKASREKYGLSHYLSGQAEYDDVCCRTNVENFDIIFAGPVPPNPSELLSGDSFKKPAGASEMEIRLCNRGYAPAGQRDRRRGGGGILRRRGYRCGKRRGKP